MKYARKCDITNEGMNEGYVVNDTIYISSKEDLLKYLRNNFTDYYLISNDDELIEMAYDDEIYYWTEWNDEDDYQFEVINGKLIEIEQ
jgi:cupin superfamily acireductone dioxygenase involved in methionine salvage